MYNFKMSVNYDGKKFVQRWLQVVDLSSAAQICDDLPDLPRNSYATGAIGGYGYQSEPLVCGGIVGTASVSQECFSFVTSNWCRCYKIFFTSSLMIRPNKLEGLIGLTIFG